MRNHAYRAVLATPHVARVLAASIVGRVPSGMGALAIVVLVRHTGGSYADAGLLTGVLAVSAAVAGPFLGRTVDRIGQTTILLACAAANAVAFVAIAALAGRVGMPALVGVAAVAGASTPPLAPCLRALWSDLLDDDGLQAAFALESTVQEMIWIVGPLLAVALAAAITPAAAVAGVAVLALTGTLWFATAPASRRWQGSGTRPTGGRAGALRSGGLRAVLGSLALVAVAFGVAEVALPAFAEDLGTRSGAGALMAVWGVGSVVGGVTYGARSWGSDPTRRFTVLLAALALSFAPLAMADGWVAMSLLLLVSGATIAPTIACGYLLIDRSAPAGALTESFTWAATGFTAGAALGNGMGGVVVDAAGAGAAFLAACAAATAGAVVARTFRSRLGTRAAAPVAEPVPAAA